MRIVSMSDQTTLFDIGNKWDEHWDCMPEFNQKNLMPFRTLRVHFRNQSDVECFFELIKQNVTPLTKSVWFPELKKNCLVNKRYTTKQNVNPKYPVYIISKNRWSSRLTSKALEEMEVPYRIVVEPQEFDSYSSVIDKDKILVLPFSNLGQGSIPARNWVWEHSISEGHERHWILDDNIRSFMRLNNNLKIKVSNGVTFRIIEDFVDRYKNIDMAGMNYQWLAKQKQLIPPVNFNTRIYSCILLKNKQPFRWRGRYNEDTDLSLQILKSGQCTALFNAFLADKMTTMSMQGGNTDELYQGDGRLKMAEALLEHHSDVCRVIRRFNRWQHYVDYRPFKKNKPIKIETEHKIDHVIDYEMFLSDIDAATQVA